MGSDRKARDSDFAGVPTAVHGKKRAAARVRELNHASQMEEELTPVAPVAMVQGRAPSASATLDEMVQLLRQGLTTDAPKALRTTELVVRSGESLIGSSHDPSDGPRDSERTATYASRFAYLPPGPDMQSGTHARCAFDSEPPTVLIPDIPRAPRLPELEGVRMMAPTVSSYPPETNRFGLPKGPIPKPLRIAGLLLLAAMAFLIAALVTLNG